MSANGVYFTRLLTCSVTLAAPFRGLVPALHSLLEEFGNAGVDFLAVYIREAHAVDEWPISSSRFAHDGNAVAVQAHKTLADRAEAARSFKDAFKFRMPLLLDGIENGFEAAYAPWPIRFFIIQDGEVLLVSEPKSAEIDIAPVAEFIRERFGKAT